MAPPDSPATSTLSALTSPQQQTVSEFLDMADTLADALSMDDLAKFNEAAKRTESLTNNLASAIQERKELTEGIPAVVAGAALHGAKDLPEARVEFHKFSMAAVPFLEKLRKAGGVPEFQVWECYMVDRVIEGAPKTGRWVQTRGRPGHNPFFGSDMLECAKEIKP
jgi:Cu(I)/Ag(I) efflux system membrane fusion protein